MTTPWHDDDGLWQTLGPLLFPESRRGAAAGEVDRVLALSGLEPGARVLDMPCGVGRHSLELARRGFAVTAVDRTRTYLDEVEASAAAEGLEIEVVHDDMRRFRRPGAFDGVLNLFSSFGYFDDEAEDLAVANNLAGSLRDGGTLVLDIFSKEVLARTFTTRTWNVHDGVILLEERAIARDWGRIDNRWIVVPPEGPRTELTLSLRIYSARELISLLLDCELSSTMCYGSLDGRPYDHEAERLVIVARK
jgi:SAM-dependent methyltransferase